MSQVIQARTAPLLPVGLRLPQADPLTDQGEVVLGGARAKPAAARSAEERLRRAPEDAVTRIAIHPEAFGCAARDRDDAVAPLLRVPDPDDAAVGVHVHIMQRERLADAHARDGDEPEHRGKRRGAQPRAARQARRLCDNPSDLPVRIDVGLRASPWRSINPLGGTSVRGSIPCNQVAKTRTAHSRRAHVDWLAEPNCSFQRRNSPVVIHSAPSLSAKVTNGRTCLTWDVQSPP